MSANYLFPILSAEEVEVFFRDLAPDLALKANDIKFPKPEKFERVYATVLENMAGISMEQITTQPLGCSFEYPEIHERTRYLVMFAVIMGRYMSSAKADGFLLKDIVDPKTKRTLHFLSAAINFYRFCEDQKDVIDRIKAKEADKRKENEKFQMENNELQAKLNNLRVKQAETKEEVDRLHEENATLEEKMSQYHLENSAEDKAINEAKTGIAESKKTFAQLKTDILEAKEEGDKLSKQIVQSPERMKSEMDRKKQQLSHLKGVMEEKIKRIVELKEQKLQNQQLSSDSDQACLHINSIFTEIEKDKELQASLRTIKDRKQVATNQLKEHTLSEEQVKRFVASKQEKLAKVSLQLQHKIANMQEIKKQLELEHQDLIVKVASTSSEQQKLFDDKQRSHHKKIKFYEATLHKMQGKYSQLLEVIDARHAGLASGWDKMLSEIKGS